MAPPVRRTQAPPGEAPVREQKAARREKVAAIAASSRAPRRDRLGLSLRARPRGDFDSGAVADFLGELLRPLRGEAIVIWGNGNMPQGEPLRAVLRGFPRRQPERQPPSAPDLNPVEGRWSDPKDGERAHYAPRDAPERDGAVAGPLEAARRKPGRRKGSSAGAKIPLLGRGQPT